MSREEEEKEKQKKEKEKKNISRVLNGLSACVKNANLYSIDHPSVNESSGVLNGYLKDCFEDKYEINVMHTDGMFVVEDDIYIEESLWLVDLMQILEKTKILSVKFIPGVTVDEIKGFVTFTLKKSKKTVVDEGETFASDHITVGIETKGDQAAGEIKTKGFRVKQIGELDQNWNERTEKVFEKLLEEQSFSMGGISSHLDKLIDQIQVDPSICMVSFTQVSKNLHVQHAVRSMFVSIALGHQLGLDPAQIKTLAVAALLHDVGRLLLPTEFQTGYKFNTGENEFVRLHTRDGAAFLAGIPELSTTIIRVALEHHIGHDGIGYPSLPSSVKPHFFSHIVGLADFTSWRTISERYYHKPIPLYRLLRTILRRSGTQFHPLLVKLLIPVFGLYPTGTRVRLSTGEEAMSLESNFRNIIRPGVGLADKNGNPEFKYLSSFSDSQPHGFDRQIEKILGYQEDVTPILNLIPEHDSPQP